MKWLKMKITIIYDNSSWKDELRSDWGFSCLIEAYGKKILFDTGGSGRILLNNMKKLGIDPKSIEEVVISHGHFDHTGGLSALLEKNKDVKVWVPPSFRGVKNAREVIEVKEPKEIHENIYLTGELEGIEQSLAIKTKKGLVVVAGCSHPGVEKILETSSQFGKPYALIGGLHGFEKYELLEELSLVCPTHCTQHKLEIRSRFPEKCEEGGAGRVFKFED